MIYRRMLDAAWGGLARTGHRHDTVLIGETAAYGASHKGYGASMDPLVFIRALYCVDGRYRPLRGAAATAVGCPASGARGAFVRSHPALFDAPGWAHHPYDFTKAPSFRRSDPNAATLSGLSHLETALNKVFGAYGKRTRIPLYITEWGVQSRGPSPYVAFSQAQQAEYINEGEYMAFKDPRVRSFSQFLFTDAAPNTAAPQGSKAYWATFQSGLLFYGPALPSRPTTRSSSRSGCRTPATAARWPCGPRSGPSPRTGTIQFQARGASTWTDVAHVAPGGTEGYISTTVDLPSAGSVRLRWDANPFAPVYSRVATVN